MPRVSDRFLGIEHRQRSSIDDLAMNDLIVMDMCLHVCGVQQVGFIVFSQSGKPPVGKEIGIFGLRHCAQKPAVSCWCCCGRAEDLGTMFRNFVGQGWKGIGLPIWLGLLRVTGLLRSPEYMIVYRVYQLLSEAFRGSYLPVMAWSNQSTPVQGSSSRALWPLPFLSPSCSPLTCCWQVFEELDSL